MHWTTQLTNREDSGPCPISVSYTLAFVLQLRKKQGKTSARVAEECQLARRKQNIQKGRKRKHVLWLHSLWTVTVLHTIAPASVVTPPPSQTTNLNFTEFLNTNYYDIWWLVQKWRHAQTNKLMAATYFRWYRTSPCVGSTMTKLYRVSH